MNIHLHDFPSGSCTLNYSLLPDLEQWWITDMLRYRWVNSDHPEPSSCRSSQYMAIQRHGAPFPLTSVYKHDCGSQWGEPPLHLQHRLDDEEFEVDWAWWMLINDTVWPELHNELFSQVFHTSANRVWLLPFILYSSVHEYAPLNLHLNCWRILNTLMLQVLLLYILKSYLEVLPKAACKRG